MTDRRKSDLEAAMQYLTWALELIEQSGHPKAALHARIALEALRSPSANKANKQATTYADEAHRFRDKADEAVQLAELAKTASRRDALTKITASYRYQMERLSKTEIDGRKVK